VSEPRACRKKPCLLLPVCRHDLMQGVCPFERNEKPMLLPRGPNAPSSPNLRNPFARMGWDGRCSHSIGAFCVIRVQVRIEPMVQTRRV